jgi:CHAT domain-containing protein
MELCELLFRDVDVASADTLLISPDGPLWLVPFDVLGRISISTQITTHSPPAVYQVPSLRIVEALRNNRRETEAGSTAVLFTKSTFASFPELPTSRDTVRTFKQHLRPAGYRLKTLEEKQATARALATAMVGATVIHISSHGIARLDGSEPYIVTDDGAGGEDRITVSTIAALQLRARVVFLSACSSAFGVNSEGEGIVSVARAFLFAGCQSVIAALWMVEEDVTAQIVERFYKAHALGYAPATALREAKAELLEAGRTQTAAAFQIYGDGENEMILSELVTIAREGLSS